MKDNDKIKILIVDDEPANIFFLDDLLSHNEFEVVSASDGYECLNVLKEQHPDLILLDIMMPGITGIEVLEKIISDQKTRDIPVIMVTAKTDAEDVKDAMSKGAIEYVKKPVEEVELLARIKTILKIKQQENELKEMLKAKKDFINMIAHDLRSPFTSIAGFAELVLNKLDDKKIDKEESKEFIGYIIDTSYSIVDYFNKLLDWSNMDSNELILKKEKIRLEKICNTTYILYKEKIEAKKISFINDIKDMEIEADPTYFNQVINNLISNAIKFTPAEGEIRIWNEMNNNMIIISISDNGIGMDKKRKNDLFEKTFHKSARGTEGEKGTGVGLTICKKIIDAHGFFIDLESEIGKGTTFYIKIPQ